MIVLAILSSALVLFSLVPTTVSVIFTKGRENYYDNGYVETTNSVFQNECLQWHNYFRQLHGAPPLTYSPELAQIARYRAIELAKKDGTNFYHHDDMEVGENLAWNSQEPIDCRIPLQLWYDEWKIYNFQRPHITARNGHFAQMVWKSSRRIGCGQAISKGKSGGTYTVCNYDPPGNWKNEETANVSPPINGVGIEFNPLGSSTNVQLPPVTTLITSSYKKYPKATSSYYYNPSQKYYKKWSTSTSSYPYDYSRYNKSLKKSYRKSSYRTPLIHTLGGKYSYYG